MPIVFLIAGAFFVAAAVNWDNGGSQVWSQLGEDLTANGKQGNFFAWAAAIILIGGVGYIDELKGISRALLVLIIVVLLLSNGGFWANLQSEVTSAAPAKTISAQSTQGAK